MTFNLQLFAKRGDGSSGMGSGVTIMSSDKFDKYVKENGTEVMFRGYSASSEDELSQRTNELLSGTHRVSGELASASGRGLYFANNEAEASGYTERRKSEQGHQYGNVVTATLKKDAKIADQDMMNSLIKQQAEEYSDLARQAFRLYRTNPSEGEKLGQESDALRNMDIGTYARSKGFDAIRTAFGETVVLNQKKLIYRK